MRRALGAAAIAAAAIVAAPPRARADEATARAAFERAEELRKAGNWADACPLYESSYRDDPRLGVLLHLAECHEQIGKLATAWAEFTDAVELAHADRDPREDAAKQEADALAPRLAHVHIVAPAPPIAGLTVTRDGVDVTALVGTDVAIDAGDHVIAAAAPGYLAWQRSISIAAQPTTTTVAIPALAKAPPPTVAATVAAEPPKVIEVVHEVAPPRPEPSPSFDIALGLAGGVKLRAGDPGVLAYRLELGFWISRRVTLGAFVESGSISAGRSCGYDMSSAPASDFDFGPHDRFTRCAFLTPGLALYVHVRPNRRVDPFIGVTPGFRFGFVDWTPYEGASPQPAQSQTFPGVVVGLRAGVGFAPLARFTGWTLGAFANAELTAYGQEQCNNCDESSPKGQTYVTLMFGAQSAVAF